MSRPNPRDGKPLYWCPHCRLKHLRKSTVGILHKAYLNPTGPVKQ